MEEIDTPEAVAEFLGVQRRTLQDWRYRGRGPQFIRVGKAIRYRKSDVEAWLTEQTIEPSEEHRF